MNKKVRYIYMLAAFLFVSFAAIAQQGELQGKVTDGKGEGVAFATVVLEQNGAIKGGAQTDFDGFYSIKPVPPGKYDVRVTYVGYQPSLTQGVVIAADKSSFLDVKISNEEGVNLGEVEVKSYKVPLIAKDNTTTSTTLTREEIANLPTRSVTGIVSTAAGTSGSNDGKSISIRGSRENGTVYIIDGVRVRGSLQLPPSAIEQMDVMVGGVPAKYGDVSGGVINITTKGASKEFHGSIEALTSYGLDPFGFASVNGSLSGPILKRKTTGQPIIGFSLSGEYIGQKDPDPRWGGYNIIKDESLERLKANPLTVTNENALGQQKYESSSKFLKADDFTKSKLKPNANTTTIRGTARLDFNLNEAMNFSIGGNYINDKRKGFDRSNNYIYTSSLLNYDNMPIYKENTYRMFGRFTHKLGVGANKEEGSESVISNVYYTLQGDYTINKTGQEMDQFKDDLFRYNYYGKYQQSYQRSFVNENGVTVQSGWTPSYFTYSSGTDNPFYSSVINTIYGGRNVSEFSASAVAQGEYGNGGSRSYVYSLFDDIGPTSVSTNLYEKSDRRQTSFNANISFDLKSKGANDRRKHSIETGFYYEQRSDSRLTLRPTAIWDRARILIDQGYIVQNNTDTTWSAGHDTIFYNSLTNSGATLTDFENRLRQRLGINNQQRLEIDAIDVSNLTMDLFSPDDVKDFVTNYGFDITGKKYSGKVTFNDFFKRDASTGNFLRPIAGFKPSFMGGYIQDKFTFKDMIFNLGVRIDRYDANQRVLKDPFLFYPAKTVAEYNRTSAPEGIPDDAYPYLNQGGMVIGYRKGSTWYNSDGDKIAYVDVLRAAGGTVLPVAKDGIQYNLNDPFKDEDFVPDDVFTDYKPSINIMPRVAFSFPIADFANFYANYDVLTQRPVDNFATPRDWYNLGPGTIFIANPNLKPEVTINYELGFRQKLTETSAFKVAAFYRELKNQVQLIKVQATPIGYTTFGNYDFGTNKGMTFEYDLRRTKNIRILANYTLQFADGTGSDSRAQFTLLDAGFDNLRAIMPFSYDQRHTINATFDYRFGEDDDYNGPKIGGVKILQNFGVNLIYRTGSGRPYTKIDQAAPGSTSAGDVLEGQRSGSALVQGTVNGARKPWTNRIDMRIEKSFKLKKGENPLYLEAFIQIENLLNTKNIVDVYQFTGEADDDGYLDSATGTQLVNSQSDPVAYRNYYMMKMANPDNFGLARTVRFGVNFNF